MLLITQHPEIHINVHARSKLQCRNYTTNECWSKPLDWIGKSYCQVDGELNDILPALYFTNLRIKLEEV